MGETEIDDVTGLLDDLLDAASPEACSSHDELAPHPECTACETLLEPVFRFGWKWGPLFRMNDPLRAVRELESMVLLARGESAEESQPVLDLVQDSMLPSESLSIEELRSPPNTLHLGWLRHYRQFACYVREALRVHACVQAGNDDDARASLKRLGVDLVQDGVKAETRLLAFGATRKLPAPVAELMESSLELRPLPTMPELGGVILANSVDVVASRLIGLLVNACLAAPGGFTAYFELSDGIRYEQTSALSIVGMQLSRVLSGQLAPVVCDGRNCDAVFAPGRKPAKGTNSYCPLCRDTGEPQRRASAAYRERQRNGSQEKRL